MTLAHFSLLNGGKYTGGSFKQKSQFKRCWEALPKYVCWSIWLTRNKAIFQEEGDNL
jgi:hypothetical protein